MKKTITAKHDGVIVGTLEITNYPDDWKDVINVDVNDENFGGNQQRYSDWKYGCDVRIQRELRGSPTSEERKEMQRNALAKEMGFDNFDEMKLAIKNAKNGV